MIIEDVYLFIQLGIFFVFPFIIAAVDILSFKALEIMLSDLPIFILFIYLIIFSLLFSINFERDRGFIFYEHCKR